MKRLTTLRAIAALCLAAVSLAHAAPDAALVQRGESLARMGDCVACHSVPGKAPYAGGVPIDSGHGIIYSSNITPDRQHGIGAYTLQQFSDAVRKGVRADGTNLYPAMPYPNYAKVSDADIQALYAYFLAGVAPSPAQPPATNMQFPFNMRWGMGLWNAVFVDQQPFRPQPGWSAQVTRGAYLVEGLGHCGSCHTPRGLAMNEKAGGSADARFLAGGELVGWPVPSLRGMAHWSEQDVVDYLQTGRNRTAAVAGEMNQVVTHSTTHVADADVQAIAAYLKALPPAAQRSAEVKPQGAAATTRKLTAATNLTLGERLYLDNCAACHFVTGGGATRIFPQLDGATVVNADSPAGLIHVVLAGAKTPSTAKAPSVLAMPAFGQRLSDAEVAELATFLRQAWGNGAAAVSAREVEKVRARLAAH